MDTLTQELERELSDKPKLKLVKSGPCKHEQGDLKIHKMRSGRVKKITCACGKEYKL
jgi:hypothetical protein